MKHLQGAWHCLSEPGVVRVFYANNSYREFGRAEPYSRHKLWRKDYLAEGQFAMQQAVLSIDKKVSFPSAAKKRKNNLAYSDLSSYKLQELTKDILFLERIKSSVHFVGQKSWLLCKKQSAINFNQFIDYIDRKRENKKKSVRLALQQAGEIRQLVHKKNRMLSRLNQTLCPDKNINILWLMNQLEQAKRTLSGEILVQMLRQKGDYFNLKISVSVKKLQAELIRFLRQTGWLTVSRIVNHKSSGKFYFNIFMRRKPDTSDCLSLVSLPITAKWLSYHQQQLTQLHRLEKKRKKRVKQRKKPKLIDSLFKSLQAIQKKLEHQSGHGSVVKFKWGLDRTNSRSFELSYASTYGELKKVLAMLYSDQFAGDVTSVKISLAQVSKSQRLTSLLQLNLMVRALSNKEVNHQYYKFRLNRNLKTPLLSIILPKRYYNLLPVIDLFY